MKAIIMLKYISKISLFLLLFSSTAYGQINQQRLQNMGQQTGSNTRSQSQNTDDEETEEKEPKIFVVKDQGISVGVDISPIIMRIINEEVTGLAFVGRYGFGNRWYGAAEVGYENTKYNKSRKLENDSIKSLYEYEANGAFLRIGMDYDIWNSEDFPTNDNIFIGFRYSYAWQNQRCDLFTIEDKYWGDYIGSIDKTSVNSHSIDALFGLRCELLPNIYMGWTFRFRFLIACSHDDILDPYNIAGYGKYDTKATMGFTYTIEYQIPFNKKKRK